MHDAALGVCGDGPAWLTLRETVCWWVTRDSFRSAKVVYSKQFTAKLARFLSAPTCTVQDVKQLEAVNHALVTVHWCVRLHRTPHGVGVH